MIERSKLGGNNYIFHWKHERAFLQIVKVIAIVVVLVVKTENILMCGLGKEREGLATKEI